jgi:hypothetical protein
MAVWQHSLDDAAQQYADQRQTKCEQRYCDRTHAITHITPAYQLIFRARGAYPLAFFRATSRSLQGGCSPPVPCKGIHGFCHRLPHSSTARCGLEAARSCSHQSDGPELGHIPVECSSVAFSRSEHLTHLGRGCIRRADLRGYACARRCLGAKIADGLGCRHSECRILPLVARTCGWLFRRALDIRWRHYDESSRDADRTWVRGRPGASLYRTREIRQQTAIAGSKCGSPDRLVYA